MNILTDAGFWISISLFAVSFLGFIMYMKEWKKFGAASELFVCITLTFGCIAFAQVINLYYLQKMVFCNTCTDVWWRLRNLPLLICVTTILIISMRRAHAQNTIWMHLKKLLFGKPLPYVVTRETDRRHKKKVPFFKRRKTDE